MTVQLVSRAVVVIALLMLTGGNWSGGAHAQGANEFASLRTQVGQLSSQGEYAEAALIAERYVALARQKHGDNRTEYAAAIGGLANAHQSPGRYAEAEPLFKRALAIEEKAAGAGDGCGEVQVCLSSTLIMAPRAWMRTMMCTPSIIDRVVRSNSATTSMDERHQP
jgi:tetratricopeptide (TPR) repeat protein